MQGDNCASHSICTFYKNMTAFLPDSEKIILAQQTEKFLPGEDRKTYHSSQGNFYMLHSNELFLLDRLPLPLFCLKA